ncbi:hypothetical protein R4578_05080 [Acinetobacter baumannii]|nr:hypothetical protein [Acinetobacter baumannii]
MIDYSPHTKYTAQKIQDKVARGAYYYSMFTIEAKDSNHIPRLIKKLDQRYELKLTSRQRSYRMSQSTPIADLIIQKSLNQDSWLFVLLITTPYSHDHAKNAHDRVKEISRQQLVKDKINELENTTWNKDQEHQDLFFLKKYFDDAENFRCVLNKPYLDLSFGKGQAELVRLTHKKYASQQDKFYRQPTKSFSWTWRFTKVCIEQKRKELTQIISRMISQPNSSAPHDLKLWQYYMNVYAVFRGTRQQAGRLYTFGKKFYFSRAKKTWDSAQLPKLDLKIILRYQTYAESFEEYDLRRYVYSMCGEELPREISKTLDEEEAGSFIEKFIYNNEIKVDEIS